MLISTFHWGPLKSLSEEKTRISKTWNHYSSRLSRSALYYIFEKDICLRLWQFYSACNACSFTGGGRGLEGKDGVLWQWDHRPETQENWPRPQLLLSDSSAEAFFWYPMRAKNKQCAVSARKCVPGIEGTDLGCYKGGTCGILPKWMSSPSFKIIPSGCGTPFRLINSSEH